MASRFWVGAGSTTNWSATTPTNWSATSGGSNNASVPGATDDVTFDGAGGGNSASVIDTSNSILTLTITSGYTNTLTHNASVNLTIAGNTFTLGANMVYTLGSATSSALIFTATTGTTTITSNGKTVGNVTINGASGTFNLGSAILLGTGSTFTLTNGTFDASGFNFTAGIWSSSNSNTRALKVGSGVWNITGNGTGVWAMGTMTNFTLTRGSVIQFTYTGGTGTRSIDTGGSSGGGSEARSIDASITAGTDSLNMGAVADSANRVYHNIDFTGFGGTLAVGPRNIYGNLTLNSTMTITSTTQATVFAGTSGTQLITTNTKVIGFAVNFNGSGGTFQLQDSLSMLAARNFTLTTGTLDLNNNNLTTDTFVSTGTATRALKMGTGTITLASTSVATVWNVTSTGLTITPSTSTIKITGSTTNIRTFAGAGLTYGNIWITNATANGEVDFTGSNTFLNFKQQDTTAQTIKFTATTTTTFSSWSANGIASNLLTLGSITAAGHTLTKAGGGFICANYLSISRSTFSPSSPIAGYAGANSTDGGNNSGWSFTNCPAGNFFLCL